MSILCPLQNEATFKTAWIQTRPVITQRFGENPDMYKPFGMKGHNGIDFRATPYTPVFAPIDGYLKIVDSGSKGYGLHIIIRNEIKDCEVIIGHLNKALVISDMMVHAGDKIGLSGNSGYSTAPHVHLNYKHLKRTKDKHVFEWPAMNVGNGYGGALDIEDSIICWKGGFKRSSF